MGRKHTPQDFWNKVNIGKPNECWTWNGLVDKCGYGRMHYQRKNWRTHRLAYTLSVEIIPDGNVVMHSCDNPPCCNPTHLTIGTHKDNVYDMMSKGRMKGRRASSQEPGCAPKLTEADVKDIRDEYAKGGTSYAKLALKYHLHRNYVANVVKRKVWKDVT